MKKQQENNTISDITTFDEEISIYKILFQDRTTALFKYIVERISIDRYETVNFRLPSILIAGKEGKQLLTRALSHSMCNSFEQVQGKHLNMGGYSGSLYRNSDSETVYYISSASELNSSAITMFHKFLTQGYFKFRNHMSGEDMTTSADNKLFIFSVNDSKKLCSDLYKAIDYHCYLKNYNTREMEIIVEQRLRWCGIDFDKEIPAIIVHNGKGSISNCIRLLSVCYLVMRGDSRTKMTIKDSEIGIALNCSQEGPIPPPFPDNDIPF